MSDFVQTMKDWRRMCKAQETIEKTDPCRVCPLANNGNDCCGIYEDNDGNDTRDYAHIEGVIARWAKEHPEPVYPSMAKYLEKFGITIRRDGSLQADFFKAHEPMDADIAEKLGMKPKEG